MNCIAFGNEDITKRILNELNN